MPSRSFPVGPGGMIRLQTGTGVQSIRDLLSRGNAGASAGKRGQPGAERALGAAAFALLLAASVMFAFQAWQSWRAETMDEYAARTASQARQGMAGFFNEVQRELGEALLHPEVARYFAAGTDGDAALALAAIRERMPEVLDGRFLVGDALTAIGTDVATFGYANAEMLLAAARSGAPAPAQVHGPAGGKQELVLVNPVTVDGKIVGFVLAKIAYEALRVAFHELATDGLELALVQGAMGEGQVLEGSDIEGLTMVPIPGAMLRVGYRVPEPYIFIGPDSSTANALVALLSLFGALALLVLRLKPELSRQMRFSLRGTPPVEPTLAEQAPGKVRQGAPPPSVDVAPPATPAATPREAAPPPAPAPPQAKPEAIDRSIFRAYDIRGVVGQTLTIPVAQLIGQAVGSEVRAKGLQTVLVGRDGRKSGAELADAVIKGLLAAGCDVIDIGAVPTPLLYFATHDLNAGSGVMVTGSHNPPEYNGFKIMVGGETLAEQDIQRLYARIVEDRMERGRGALTQMDLVENYIERISGDIQLEQPLKVVIDCGNGIAGAIAPRLFEAIGCDVVPLYCDVDGNFPNHHPDPSDPRNLQDLMVTVKQMKADLGLAFDGDGDRLGVVTRSGQVIYPDRLLMLFARDVLVRAPGATIIYDVKCTGHLSGVILGHGGSPIMWKTGHSLIKRKMKETGAELAGEMSGHFFFQERWYGFDDGLYAGCRLLEIVAADGRDPDEIFEELPQGVCTPELKVPMAEGEHYRFIEKFRDRARFDGARITTIDGVRADWSDGWGLVRCSNTTPSLVLRFDAADGDALARIQGVFRAQLLAVDAKLALPF